MPRPRSIGWDIPGWEPFIAALTEFHEGGPRGEFVAACKKILAEHPGSQYEDQLQSLVRTLEREAATPRPAFLDKRPENRTEEERIRYWIYQLRDLGVEQHGYPGYPSLFSSSPATHPTAADQLVAIGPAAIPYLVEAVDDDTPTRTMTASRHWAPQRCVLRRQDVAIHCLEKIVGCRFYFERGSGEGMQSDDPKRRESAIANVRAWWAISEGASQAQMIRNQLALGEQNLAVRSYLTTAKTDDLGNLAMLEGPEAVVEEGRRLLAADRYGLNSPVVALMHAIDPQAPIRAVFDRFWNHRSRPGDYTLLYRYGDKRVYQEIARRYKASGMLDPGAWIRSGQARAAAKYGQNWAIPILARMLDEVELPRKHVGDTAGVTNACMAVELLQELASEDFGYRRGDPEKKRLAAITKARQWWLLEGSKELAAKIAEDHPPVIEPGDLFLSDEEIAARVAAIESGDPERRRKAIASLGTVHGYQIQRAILSALVKEERASDRVKMLEVLLQKPWPWHFSVLAQLLEGDGDPAVRVLAARCIQKSLRERGRSPWWTHWVRLETRESALEAARRVACDAKNPAEVRTAAVDMLLARGWLVDQPVLHSLATDPVVKQHEPLMRYLHEKDERTRRWPKRKPPQE